MIRFNCAGCGKLVQVPDQHAGKKGKCPHCRTLMKIPPCEDAIGDPITACDDELDDEEGGVIDETDLTPELRAKINALDGAGGWEGDGAANNEEGGVIDESDLTPELRAKINGMHGAGGWEAGGAANNEDGGVIDEGDLTPELRAKINALHAAGGCEVISAFQTIGLPVIATFDQMKGAYRKLCTQFHPDTLQGKNLNPEFLEFGTKRFKEIRRAYELLCEAFAGRGIP